MRPRLVELRRLARSAAARRAEGVFLVEGATLVSEAADSGLRVREVYLAASRADEETRQLAEQLAAAGVALMVVESEMLAKVGTSVTPQPLLAVVERPTGVEVARDSPEASRFVLVAVSVADPGNAGTLLRCAEAASAESVIFAGQTVDPYGPKAVRASAGSIFRLSPTLTEDPVVVLEDLSRRGLRVLGASVGRGSPYDLANMSPPLALVVGSESHGLPDALARLVDEWVHVPLAGQAESLNVAAAAAVLCFEVQRRCRSSRPHAAESPAKQ